MIPALIAGEIFLHAFDLLFTGIHAGAFSPVVHNRCGIISVTGTSPQPAGRFSLPEKRPQELREEILISYRNGGG